MQSMCAEYQHSHPFLPQLLPFFTEDGRAGGSDVATIGCAPRFALGALVRVRARNEHEGRGREGGGTREGERVRGRARVRGRHGEARLTNAAVVWRGWRGAARRTSLELAQVGRLCFYLLLPTPTTMHIVKVERQPSPDYPVL